MALLCIVYQMSIKTENKQIQKIDLSLGMH